MKLRTPNQDRKLGFWRAFWSERKLQPSQFMIALASISSSIITLVGLTYAVGTLNELQREGNVLISNQASQTYSNVYQSQFGLDQFIGKSPELMQYFEENKAMPDPSKAGKGEAEAVFLLRQKVRAAAEYELDTFDNFFSQARFVWKGGQFQNDEYYAWVNYYADQFEHSQVLCEVLTQYQDEYASEIKVIALEHGCRTINASPAEIKRVNEEIANPEGSSSDNKFKLMKKDSRLERVISLPRP